MYTKFYMKLGTTDKLSNGLNHDFVSTYCKVNAFRVSENNGIVSFEETTEAGVQDNPIRFSAWQKMKNEYPRYAYPGFQNRVQNGNAGVKAVVTSIFNAAKNLTELRENFYVKAQRKKYASEVNLPRCFVRVSKYQQGKVGGGVRVKQIDINDDWKGFTGNTNAPAGMYGQSYDYTTMENGRKVSTGVASYEPAVGNDENPLKQPVPYIQRIKGAINNYFELEEPFGESFFPAPSVGYSKVTVRDFDATGSTDPETGAIVNEFYTSKEFPVKVKVMPIKKYNPKPSNYYSLVHTNSIEELILSQGYSIELNDMHGKTKATRVLNKVQAEISSTVYHYAVENPNAVTLSLNNKVDVIDERGVLQKDAYIGRDIEFFTDFREQESKNSGLAVNLGVDVVPLIGPFPIPHWPINGNNEYKLFRSACAVKVVQNYGIVKKVVKTQDGSSIEVENIAYDGLTGEAIITRTQNEFNKDFYTTNIPAYWTYPKMGGAYRNLGVILNGLTLNTYREISEAYSSMMAGGDEIVDLSDGKKYWVIERIRNVPGEVQALFPNRKLLIDVDGKSISSLSPNGKYKIVRSAFRNQLGSSSGTIVSMNNPLINGKLDFMYNQSVASALKAVNAAVTTYDEKWPIDGNGQSTNVSLNPLVPIFVDAGNSIYHGQYGARYFNPCSVEDSSYCGQPYLISNPFISKRLDDIGIWVEGDISSNINNAVGFVKTFEAPTSGYYYIGFGGDDRIKFSIDGSTPVVSNNAADYWEIKRVYLTKGTHSIEVEGYNEHNSTGNTLTNNPGSIGLEIYNASMAQIVQATSSSNLGQIFSTQWLINDYNLQTFKTISSVKTWRLTYDNFYNPFVNGMLGNWRVLSQKVFQGGRAYDGIFDAGKRGVDAVNSGYLKTFTSYWAVAYHGYFIEQANQALWTTANTVMVYDKYGQELENKDALERYSAATFGFNGELPTAVASNAMNREIYANGFEDLVQNGLHKLTAISPQSLQSLLDNTQSHTGNTSLKLDSYGIQIRTKGHALKHRENAYFQETSTGYQLYNTAGLYPNGFEAVPGKKYILATWIKDGFPGDKTIRITATVKGGSSEVTVPITLSCKAIVEGWKLIEGEVTMPNVSGTANSIDISIKANSTDVFIDDLRIHPYDAHLKSYAYNAKDFKLMAELDENCFATFYEYDDAGALIRVKKETERGIITVKENRSSYRKKI